MNISYYKTENIDIEKLTPLQGNLKDLSEENYQKLKRQIMENGFSMPFVVWQDKGTIYILDGHQRHRVLMKMREEGETIPEMPCNFIKCKNKSQAKIVILALTSQYGNMTEEGLDEFLADAEIGLEYVKDNYRLPDIDFGYFEDNETDYSQANSEIDVDELTSGFNCTCPKCGFEFEYKKGK